MFCTTTIAGVDRDVEAMTCMAYCKSVLCSGP